MKKIIMTIAALMATVAAINAKTLIVYYSFTNNVHAIVGDLQTQLPEADVIRIEPAEEGIDYAADNYAAGSALIAAIRENPDDASSYPEIKPVNVDLSGYDEIVVAVPLWWSSMAAPMQTFLFHNGGDMAGKRIGLIVSSASSGISGVEADARRLIPDGNFIEPSLWIRSSQTSDCHTMIEEWLNDTGIGGGTGSMAVAVAESKGIAGVYCNDGMLNVDGNFDRLYLYDAAGLLLLETTAHATDVKSLPAGVYIATLLSGQDRFAGKVIVD